MNRFVRISLLALFCAACSGQIKYSHRTDFLMDSYCTITVPNGQERAMSDAFRTLRAVERSLDRRTAGAILREFNERTTSSVTDRYLVGCFNVARDVWDKSSGAFDLTTGILTDLWGFNTDSPRVPSARELSVARGRGGMESFKVRGRTLSRDPGATVRLDLGGAGQGYGVREALSVLRAEGVMSALIDCSGDIYALGSRAGRPWRIAVRDPFGSENYPAVLEVTNMAVVTSGTYERGFTNNGIWYHHILDPKTGFPARGLSSVTVVDPDPAFADCWSTALLVMGEKRALELSEAGIAPAVLLVTDDRRVVASKRMKAFLAGP
jgi:thiamine biosynthesis lipoprotein